ncbi:MAG: ParB/RepB/Spo0J family partition protein [Phycisphaerae bacterium]
MNSTATDATQRVLPLKSFRMDGGTQPRVEMDEELIAEYAERMRVGDEFPPLEVFLDEVGRYWLVDGFHRAVAADEANLDEFPCVIREGELEDAIAASASANAQHGKRRTNADKRRAVEALLSLDKWRSRSNCEIARQAMVSEGFVRKVREELSSYGTKMDATRTVRRGDQTYTQDTSNIGLRKEPASEPPAEPDSEAEAEAEPAADDGPPTDRFGNELPPHVAEDFARAGEIQELLTQLTRIKSHVARRVSEGDRLYRGILHAQVSADLTNARREIGEQKPYALCPICGADSAGECRLCRDRGWLGQFAYKTHVPEDMKWPEP